MGTSKYGLLMNYLQRFDVLLVTIQMNDLDEGDIAARAECIVKGAVIKAMTAAAFKNYARNKKKNSNRK